MKEQIIKEIEEQKIVAILRGVPAEKLLQLAEALYAGGIRLLEITFSADKSVSDEETARRIGLLCDHFAGKMAIGAGTVLTTEQVKLTKAAGGSFIICPNVDADVIELANELGMVTIPGALTPTEIVQAHNAGADFVKLFPVAQLGVDYVKAVKAPLSHIKMLAVGGINTDNMPQYLETGICGFGIGANIADKKLIDSCDWQAITENAMEYRRVIGCG